MIDRIVGKLREARHLRAARAVLETPPIVPGPERVVLFSMIGTRVLLPYLVAVKSLHARLRVGRVAILDDGTLTAADKAVLAHHCGDPEIRSIRDVDTGVCPAGGCWERLLSLLAMTAGDYVIQVDSDTITAGDVPEVAAAIRANRSFTLLGGPEAGEHGILSLDRFMAVYHPEGSDLDPAGPAHVQLAIESHWDRYPDPAAHRYVRGCAGFAGFARGGFGRAEAETFSRQAEAIVGHRKWCRWGSEQVASNFLIANSADPVLLPYARYLNRWDEPPGAEACFVHFVGMRRYTNDDYLQWTRRVVAAL